MILEKLKSTLKLISETVTEAVINAPAYFNDAQRQATKDGQIAGLEVKRIINEPTGHSPMVSTRTRRSDRSLRPGWWHFDCPILEIGDGVFEAATNGDTHLGGDNWDSALIDYLIAEFKSDGIDLRTDKMALQLQRRRRRPRFHLLQHRAPDQPASLLQTLRTEAPQHHAVTS